MPNIPHRTPLLTTQLTTQGHAPTAPIIDTLRRAQLLPLWPRELADKTLAGRGKRVALLRKALRAERQRGLAGHWTYDLARHWGLLRWYRIEVIELAEATTANLTVRTKKAPVKISLEHV